jgi:AbiU2
MPHNKRAIALIQEDNATMVLQDKDWNTESVFDDILFEGVVLDVYEAELAIKILDFIRTNADTLYDNFPDLFYNLERILTTWIFLAIARLYEEKSPRSKYPLRTIPEALKILEKEEILIKDKLKAIDKLPVPGSVKEHLTHAGDSDFLKSIAEYFRTKLEILRASIDTIRDKRDKIVAHREAINEMKLKRPDRDEVDELVSFAKSFYEVVGEGIRDRYIGSDPASVARSLRRLITQAGISVL